MDFDRHTLFCYECDDYIYDTELDEKVIRSELISSKSKQNMIKSEYLLCSFRIKAEEAKDSIYTLGTHQ
jgi:hypothetical protein